MAYPFQDTECSNLSIDSRQRIRSDWGRLRSKIGSKAKKVSADLSSKVLAFKPLTKAIKQEQQSRHNKFKFEGLEPRLLFSADPLTALLESATNMELTVESDSVLLRDLSDNSILAQQLLADTSSVFITGSLGDDSLTINDSIFANGNSLSVTFEGGDGVDNIIGQSLDTNASFNWGFVGYEAYNDTDKANVLFKDVESLVGGAGDNNLFGDDEARDWLISSASVGMIDDMSFQNFSYLNGGAGEDSLAVTYNDADTWNITSNAAGSVGFHEFQGFEFLQAGSSLDSLLNFSGYDSSVNVFLAEDATTSYGSATGFSGIKGFEHITGSAYNDTLHGDSAVNIIRGLAGNDSLLGGESVDQLFGGDGTQDILDVSRGLDATLNNTELNIGALNAELESHSGFELARFSAVGDQGVKFDVSAFSGSAILIGGDGDDELIGTVNDDNFIGGLGADIITGGLGVNTLIEDVVAEKVVISSTQMVSTASLANPTDEVVDTLSGISEAIIVGDDGDNIIDASSFLGTVVLGGGEGNDQLIGSAQDDVLTGGAGIDSIDGGGGSDQLVESARVSRGDARMILTDTSFDIGDGIDEVINITVGDVTSGTFRLSYADELSAEINVTDSPDELRSTLSQLQAFNTINIDVTGVAGDWVVTFVGSVGGLDIGDFTITDQSWTPVSGSVAVVTQGQSLSDTLVSIEKAYLTGSVNDDNIDASLFTGETLLLGSSGSDVILGGLGVDDIDGGEGDDTISGGAGADVLKGGAGLDILQESRDADFVLTDATLKTTISSVEVSDILSGIEAAKLTGGAGDNSLDASSFYGVNTATALTLFNQGQGLTVADGSDIRIKLEGGQ